MPKRVFDRQILLLCAAAFTMAASLSTWWTSMPYLLRGLGGTEKHVGLAPALNMLGYAIFLLVANRYHRLNCRRATRRAVAVMLGACWISALGVVWATSSAKSHTTLVLWLTIAMGGIAGGAMAFYWPFLMSWVSADLEGRLLNQRLGSLNRGWSGAVLFGPLIGTGLVDVSHKLPLVAAGLFMVLCWLSLIWSRGTTPIPAANVPRISANPALSRTLLWMARLALLCTWAAMAITRSQFALRFNDLGYHASLFGVLIMLNALVNFLVLAAMGRWHLWHGRKGWLWLAPLLGGGAMALLARGTSLPVFILALSLQGVSLAISYCAHQYYGAAGSTTRSASMSIHELTIAASTLLGAAPAGYLAYYAGPRSPYWFGMGLCAAALVGQGLVLLLNPKNKPIIAPA